MMLVSPDFGQYPFLKGFSYFLATMFLLLGVQSMYQKFYSAKTAADAKKAVALWIVGTVVVETVVVVIAIYASSYYWNDPPSTPRRLCCMRRARWCPLPWDCCLLGAAVVVVLSTGMNYLLSPSTNLMRDIYQRFINPDATQSRMVATAEGADRRAWASLAFLMIFIPTVLKSRYRS
jgi:solute:Na+ symporter, SSS family